MTLIILLEPVYCGGVKTKPLDCQTIIVVGAVVKGFIVMVSLVYPGCYMRPIVH